jgi:hypothetical protein
MTKYFVHRYDVIRIKVAVEANSQAEAIVVADEFLDRESPIGEATDNPNYDGNPLNWVYYQHAEETTGYLVDEFGDRGEHQRSAWYNEAGEKVEGGF